jgi:hypothetical protein
VRRRRADVGHPQGDQGVEEGRGQGPGQPVVEVELEAVGDGLDQALEPDLDTGGKAEEQAQDPEAGADQGLDAGGVAEEDRPGDAMAPAGICEPSTRTSLQPSQLPPDAYLAKRCSAARAGREALP